MSVRETGKERGAAIVEREGSQGTAQERKAYTNAAGGIDLHGTLGHMPSRPHKLALGLLSVTPDESACKIFAFASSKRDAIGSPL